jgi:2,4-dienoyl-CoA reductase-like NADH-dependent reductase (Old Yellow Enzyme family)
LLDVLWEPLALRGVVLPNRVMCSATTLQYGVDGLLGDRHVAFYRERARGGVGLLVSEQLTATSISRTPFPRAIAAYEERQVERFNVLAAALRDYETRFFVQLVAGGGGGASTVGLDHWGPVRAPSAIPIPGGEVPLPLEAGEIEQVILDFAHSARNVRAGGLHGVEVHGAHGWLVGQFLSPFYNRRDDAYGGSVEKRCRLSLEIGRAIRDEVGQEFPVGLAMTYDECIGAAGISIQETEAQLAVLAEAGIYDFFDLSIGSPHSEHLTISSMSVPEGYAFGASARAKRVVGDRAAVFVAGRVVDLGMAARAVTDGSADVVAMTRAHLADPHLVRKARQGRPAETARCVGDNTCVNRALHGAEVVCVVNPAVGREEQWGEGTLVQTASPKWVVVVGAGPAGLRFAATIAQRGHRVSVHERETEPGGHLREIAWLPTRESWRYVVEDLVATLERHGGALIVESAPTADRLVAGAPDIVVVATGARWDESGVSTRRPERAEIPGLRSTNVLGLGAALAQARNEPRSLGHRVIIADETGAYPPLGLAEALAAEGVEVHLVTPSDAIGESAAGDLELPHVLPRLRRLGVTLTALHDIGSVNGSCVVLDHVWGGPGLVVRDVDSIVLALQRSPRDELFLALRRSPVATHLVGDARTPRTTTAVIHEAESFARAL